LVACGGSVAGAAVAPEGGSDAEGAPGADASHPAAESGVGPIEAGAAESSANVHRPFCGGTVTPGQSDWCTGVDMVTFSNPRVADPGGRAVSAGHTAVVQVTLENTSMRGIDYPCVGFAADNPGVTFVGDDPVGPDLYALAPGLSLSKQIDVQLAASIPSGTVVQFTAWADVLHSGCTNGAQIQWNVTVN
jgi:hypothetical protein